MNDIVPDALKDPRIRTEFVDANHLRFEVDVCGSGDRLALCLHGFPEHSFSWRYQLPMLADLGYTAWAPNLRGYGHSSRPEGIEAYSLENLLADVAGLIDAAGRREVVLLAHDWGAEYDQHPTHIIVRRQEMRYILPHSKLRSFKYVGYSTIYCSNKKADT